MAMTETRRYGRFWVDDNRGDGSSDRWHMLRVCQEGCAVLRCEHHEYAQRFEITAEHPDFDEVPLWEAVPLYVCEITQVFGNEPGVPKYLRRFVREGAQKNAGDG